MIVNISKKGNVTIITPEGRIDTTTSKAFSEELNKAKADGIKDVVMSFEKVDYISSAGLRNIIMFAKYLKSESGKFALCNLNKSITDVFTVSGFDKVINILPKLEDAINSFN